MSANISAKLPSINSTGMVAFAESLDSLKSKNFGEKIISALLVIGFLGLLVLAIIDAVRENKVKETCKKPDRQCLVLGKAAQDSLKRVAPAVINCTTQGFASPGCLASVTTGYLKSSPIV